MTGKTIEEDGDNIIFGDISCPKSVKTNFRVNFGRKKNEGEAWEYYTLETLVFFWKNRTVNHPKYVENARNNDIIPIRRPDRRALQDYLGGVRDRESPAAIEKAHSNFPTESD